MMILGLILATWLLVIPALIVGVLLVRAAVLGRGEVGPVDGGASEPLGAVTTLAAIEVGKSDYLREERAPRLVALVSDARQPETPERPRSPQGPALRT